MTLLYQVTLRWIKTEVNPEKIEPAFDACGNWARLNAYSWFVWSNLTGDQIYELIRPYMDKDDGIAIFAVNPVTKAGWAPGWFWEWVDSKGTKGVS